MSSREFAVWMVLDRRGELPDQWDLTGTLAAAVMNAGFRYPKKPVGAEDFRPKVVKRKTQRERLLSVAKKLIAKPELTNDMTWNT